MRITGGTARGRVLQVPRNVDIRPTTDRTREAVFSMLVSLTQIWDRCLDLYAGTGALGIEALSRGAGRVDFVEKERRNCDNIKRNLLTLGFKDNAHVYCFDVSRAISELKEQFDIIFMDPPYADKTIENIIEKLSASQIVRENTVLVVSHSSRVVLKEEYGILKMIKNKKYGDTSISIYNLEARN